MSNRHEDRERDLLRRPFLDRSAGRYPSPYSGPPYPGPPPETTFAPGPQQDVRPYLMTGGRTTATGADVAMETVVVLTALARNGPTPRQAFERAQRLRLCRRPTSVAELAARLGIPLGVAVVLVTDLLADGLLDAATARREQQAFDVAFLERLIAGVSAL